MHGVRAADASLQGWANIASGVGALVRPVPGDGGRETRLWVLLVFRVSRCLWAEESPSMAYAAVITMQN